MVIDYKKQIIEYLKKNLSKGYTLESLKIALLRQGYSKSIIERAVEQTNEELAKKAPEFKEKPKIKYEIVDEFDKPVLVKKSFWKKFFE